MKNVRSGVGYVDTTDSKAAGRAAAEKALANACANECGLALAFCGGNHDPIAFLKAVEEVVKDATLIGGTAVGVISNESTGLRKPPAPFAGSPQSARRATLRATRRVRTCGRCFTRRFLAFSPRPTRTTRRGGSRRL